MRKINNFINKFRQKKIKNIQKNFNRKEIK